jgi:uncharacterized protein
LTAAEPPPHPARRTTARGPAGQRLTLVQRRRGRKGYRPAVVKLYVLDDLYAVVRCDPDAPLPDWACGGPFWSVTRSDAELSVVCREDDVPATASAERGWCALELAGPLDFSLTGVVSALVVPLAEAEVPIFVLSTFETDYLLVRERDLERSVSALTAAGHAVDS